MNTQQVIWKVALRPWTIFVDVPRDATLLSAGAQDADIVVWFLCMPEQPLVSRLVCAHPTGTPLTPAIVDSDAAFVDTVQMNNGLVFHVFDGGEYQEGRS